MEKITTDPVHVFIENDIPFLLKKNHLFFACCSCQSFIPMHPSSTYWCCHACSIDGDINTLKDILADAGFSVYALS